MKRYFLIILFLIIYASSRGICEKNPFPVPAGLEERVQFWVDVFTDYSQNHVIIHDSDFPEKIYRIVHLQPNHTGKRFTHNQKRQLIKKERDQIVALLKRLAYNKVKKSDYSEEESYVLKLFGKKPKISEIRRAVYRVHAQSGMKEAFVEGLIRSGEYDDMIRNILSEHDLPEDLINIIHIESSFNPKARSVAGAVGMWQITHGAGKPYLKVGRGIDERKDPILSSKAAACILKNNYDALGSWPLAITAYNYGLNGMHRAVRYTKTEDLGKIIQRHKNRRFGFASKNFYAEFLAVKRIAENPDRFFGDIRVKSPAMFKVVQLPFPMSVKDIATTYGIDETLLKEINPAWTSSIVRGKYRIPKNYRLRLPGDTDVLDAYEIVGFHHRADPEALHNDHIHTKDTKDSMETAPSSIIVVSQDSVLHTENRINKEEIQKIGVNESQWVFDDILNELSEINRHSIKVHAGETLGHYADWLNVPTWRLRHINNLKFGQPIRIGQYIRLDFQNVKSDLFREKRVGYHKSIQNDFFKQYQLEGSLVYTIREGETLWSMVSQRKEVPLWLILAMNYGKDLHRIQPGDKLVMPVVKKVS